MQCQLQFLDVSTLHAALPDSTAVRIISNSRLYTRGLTFIAA
ncbi:hypothetical protein glysoja_046547 [Glycine soja]|uniref:Uncharacterized protein n=1 Tax=Glycine soja TaxID=3848 RepID=A0A0B2QHF0_GLYSO|nr:hypothetical protein glysoja_046547 [Glycine soja]